MLKNKKKRIAIVEGIVFLMAIYKFVDFRFKKNLFSNERTYNQVSISESDIVEKKGRKTLHEIING